MNVTGFLLREAIKRWELRRDAAATQFEGSLYKFEKETKTPPDEVFKSFATAEENISRLEAAQARYNLKVSVAVQDKTMTLCEAIKRLGGAGRGEKMWMKAANPKKDRYDYSTPTVRDPNQERAMYVLSPKEFLDRANKAATYSGSLRAAIAKGNGTEIPSSELFLEPALLTE